MSRLAPAIAAALAASAVAAAGATALPKPPPVKDGVSCHLDLKQTYSERQVVAHGLPLDVTCSGPARFLPAVNFLANTPQARELTDASGHSIPAQIAYSHVVTLKKAGTSAQKGRFLKLVKRILDRHKKTRVLVTLAIEREDGSLWSEPKSNRRITLVR